MIMNMIRPIHFLVVTLTFLLSCKVTAADPRVWYQNHLATDMILNHNSKTEPKWSEIKEKLLSAVTASPFSPELHLNLGLAFEGLGEIDKAIASYKTAESLSASNPDLQFVALFNEAQAVAKQKKIDEALALYQKALSLQPDSKPVKINIEMLLNSQGQGEGEGDGKSKDNKDQNDKDNKDDKDGKGKEPQKFQSNPKEDKNKSKFQSKELSESDVKKILDDIKSQENRIRGEYDKKNDERDSGNDKPW